MTKISLVDVTRSKPISVSVQSERQAIVIDLLWPYRVHRLVLDTDIDEAVQSSTLKSLPEFIEASTDGKKWAIIKSSWVPASRKSRHGSGPSFASIFVTPVLARYVRVLIASDVANPSVRLLSVSTELQGAENQKFLLKDEPNEELPTVSVGIVGDSNAVMRYGMKKSFATGNSRITFDATLGASSILFSITTLDGIDVEPTDALIINANVVEYPLLKDPNYRHELGADSVRNILSFCQKNSIFPIRVIWPQMKYINIRENDPNPSLAPDRYFAEQSKMLGIPFIDGYRLLDKISQSWNRTHVSLFKYRDEAHLSHMPSQIIGRAIRRLLVELKQSGELKHLEASTIPAPRLTMAHVLDNFVPALRQQDVEIHRVETSLISQDFIQIRMNDAIEIRVPEGFEVVGYLIDARRCNSTLTVSGQTSVSKRANFSGYKEEDDAYPFVCVRTLPKPIIPLNGKVVVRCSPFDISDHPDNICKEVHADQSIVNGRIHLGDLVLRSVENQATPIRTTLEELDLTDRVILP